MVAERHTRKEIIEGIEARRALIERATEASSALPIATFGACDPMVEAKLLNEVVMQVFLQHMGKAEAPITTNITDERAAENRVSADDVRELLTHLDMLNEAPAPELGEGLASERLWILADIATEGSGVARQRATHELRTTMSDLRSWSERDVDFLPKLVARLEGGNDRTRSSALFVTLLNAARDALRETRGESRP